MEEFARELRRDAVRFPLQVCLGALIALSITWDIVKTIIKLSQRSAAEEVPDA